MPFFAPPRRTTLSTLIHIPLSPPNVSTPQGVWSIARAGWLACGAALALASCKPPATDGYQERVDLAHAGQFASAPIVSPDTEDAIWARSGAPLRIVYGLPGAAPQVALECAGRGSVAALRLTRFAPADAEAKALAALIGNGHIARLPVAASWNGRAWIWQGEVAPLDPRLDVLTGTRSIELTIPGAGSVVIASDGQPAALIAQCRQLAAEGATGVPVPPAGPA